MPGQFVHCTPKIIKGIVDIPPTVSWTLFLPDELREELRVPLGKIVNEDELPSEVKNSKYIIAVGDEVTLTCRRKNIDVKMCIVDFKTKRRKDEAYRLTIGSMDVEKVSVKNPRGTITEELWKTVDEGLKSPDKICIIVDGEEDLAALPCIFLAENGSKVLYGMPDRGIVVVPVNEENKKIIGDVLNKMSKKKIKC